MTSGAAEDGPERLARLVRERADWCRSLGSPLYATLLIRLADDSSAVTKQARLAPLRVEAQRRSADAAHEFLVRLRTWPGGEDRILGVAHPRGIPTTWE